MLDVNVSFDFPLDSDVGTVRFSLFTKPSSIWRPLSPDSNHPKSIHDHWPLAQCNRIMGKFSCPTEGRRAVEAFKSLYFSHFGVPIKEQRCKPDLPDRPSSWIVLPYNLCLVLGGITRAVMSLVFPDGFCVDRARLSWRLGGKHLVQMLRRHNQAV